MKAVEAKERLQRPPLTAIKERIRLYADELSDDVKAVVFIEYPSGESGSFGAVLERSQIVGILTQASHNICSLSDAELNPSGGGAA